MVNDRHPSGVPSPDAPGSDFSYTAYSTDYGQSNYGASAYSDGDPLFGTMPGAYDQQAATAQTSGYGYPVVDDGTGQWFGVQETTSWGTGTWSAAPGYTDQAAAYGYEGYEGYDSAYPATDTNANPHAGYEQQAYGHQDPYGAYAVYGQDASGQWNFSAAQEYDATGSWHFPDTAADTPHTEGAAYENHEVAYDHPAAQDPYAYAAHTDQQPQPQSPSGHEAYAAYDYDYEAAEHTRLDLDLDLDLDEGYASGAAHDYDEDHGYEPDGGPDTATLGAIPQPRGRRRSPKPRRRALLTVAVPSVAVLGVAGAAAASVLGGGSGGDGKSGGEEPAAQAADDTEPTEVKPSQANRKLDTQLAGLSADADDFADRASRTQERIDLKERQKAEKERKAKEAARKEAMRPKFVLPVKDHQLSARYGQAGMNWMSVHTGIDFPVSYGTPVMAATDGTVSTKYDMSYGNMAVVTAKDGTETWYCHLSSNKIRSGEVKAGDTIAYSGNSGNSTGPHLHFEVRPGGGSAVDPIPWLQDKGLEIS